MSDLETSPKVSRHRLRQARKETIVGYFFISPWLVGFFVWIAGPMLMSLVMSFLKTDLLTPSNFVGFEHYTRLVEDELFWKSLRNTAYYSVLSVSLGMCLSLVVAMLMNTRIKGITLFRTIYYLPAILPAAPVAILWRQIFNPDKGLANSVLRLIGLPPQKWLYSEEWALPCLVLMNLWGIGATMMIYLAGLQSIPEELYEASEIDGAGSWSKLRYVTLPMLSPTIFFNLIMSIIGSFLIFTSSYVMTSGGPNNATLTYVLYLYRNGFEYFKFGYASALAWVLFFIVLALSAVVFRSSTAWVYYESESRGE